MIEKGNKLADQLEASFAVSRARSRVSEPVGPQMPREREVDEHDDETPTIRRHQPVMEQPTLVARNSNNANGNDTGAANVPATSRERTAASLTAVLEKISGRNGANGAKAAADAPRGQSNSRSKAEQELLALLRGGMKG